MGLPRYSMGYGFHGQFMDSMNRYLPLPVSWIIDGPSYGNYPLVIELFRVLFWGKPLTGGIWRQWIPMIRDHYIYPIVVYIQYSGHNVSYHHRLYILYIYISIIIGFILSYIIDMYIYIYHIQLKLRYHYTWDYPTMTHIQWKVVLYPSP